MGRHGDRIDPAGRDRARPRRARFGRRRVLAEALADFRRHPVEVLAVAISAALITSAAELAVDHYLAPGGQALAGSLITTALSLLATVFVAGCLCRVAGEVSHGEEHSTVLETARTLPWGSLVLADLLYVVLAVAGLVLFIVPGLIVITVLAVIGPVIEIEHRRAFAAARRSVSLVRQRFWTVVLLATLPLILAGLVESVVPEPHDVPALVVVLAVRGIGGGIVEAAVGLVLVEVTFRLIELDAGPRRRRKKKSGPASPSEPGEAGEPGTSEPGTSQHSAAQSSGPEQRRTG
jgi:hypothetical protein